MTTASGRRALRWGLAAAAVTGVATYAAGAALGLDVSSTSESFVLFAVLFGGTAAFLGAEVTRYRRCPRCDTQQEGRAGRCPECGYDVATRPRWVCPEGHAYAFDEGLCDCGRRLRPWVAPDVAGHVRRSVALGAALLVALVVTGLLLGR
jgi:hypothetical protein